MRLRVLATLSVAVAALVAPGLQTAHAYVSMRTVQLTGADGGTEPRVTIDGTNGMRYVITNVGGTATVYSSPTGTTWTRQGDLANQTSPTIDVDIVETYTHRLIATELDFGGINFRTSYSDDGGKTWTASTGTEFADQDRPWLATGPRDPVTGQPDVYLLFHDLLSGTVQHDMFVQKSTDGGVTFGAPIPIALPPSQAWQDLQCADSGGPSNLFVNQKTGQVYAVWGTRSSSVAGGGCGASVTGSQEINVVAATRVWVATSPDDSPGSWTTSLAVDDNATGQIVGMQLAPGALDNQGNVYIVYPESIHPYPDYSGAAIKYTYATPSLTHWSWPVTVAKSGGDGNLLPHIVAGDPGKLDIAYFHGGGSSTDPLWYTTVAQVFNGMAATPSITTNQVSTLPTYDGTASQMMGACTTSGVENGFICGRSTDVWGIALDQNCLLTITWPSVKNTATNSVDGTWVSTQTAGLPICKKGMRP